MFRRKISSVVLPLVLLCVAVGSLPSAHSAEYRLEPSLYLRSFVDDNLLLNAANEIETFALVMSPRLNASITSETWRYQLDTKLSFIRMEDDQFNSDDQDVSFSAIRIMPKFTWQFLGQMKRASTRTTDLESTGVVDERAQRRDQQTFRPVMQWTFNPKNQVTFGVSVQNVHYNALAFNDYDVYGGDITWSRQINEKTVLELSGFGSLYKSESFKTSCAGVFFNTETGDFESETYGLELGFKHQVNTQLKFSAAAGRRKVASSTAVRTCFFGSPFFSEDAGENKGLVLDAGLEYVGEKYRITATISRAVNPAGLGFLLESNDVSVLAEYRIAEKFTGRLNLSAYDNKAIDESIAFARDGIRVQPSLVWRMTDRWKLDGGLNYRTLDSQNTSEREGLQIFVGAQYDFKPRTASR